LNQAKRKAEEEKAEKERIEREAKEKAAAAAAEIAASQKANDKVSVLALIQSLKVFHVHDITIFSSCCSIYTETQGAAKEATT
jgi:hypothetical protein